MSGRPQDSPEALRGAIEEAHALLLDRAIEPGGSRFVDAELAAGYLALLRSLAQLPREHLLGLRVIADLRDAGFARGRALRDQAEAGDSASEMPFFRRLADASGYGFAVADTSGVLTYANRALCRMLGLESPSVAVGRSMLDHIASESRSEFAGRILPAVLRQGQWVGELPVRSAAGTLTPAIQNLFLVHGDERGVDHLAALVLDITDRKRAETALQQAKEYAENLIETANAIVVVLDARGEIQVFNRAAEEITGYGRDELKGRSWFEALVPRERYPYVWEAFRKLEAGRLPRNLENPILTRDGEERYIIWQNSELREGERIIGTVSFGVDITEHRRAEEALRESEENFRALAENAHDGILIAAGAGRYVYANARASEITGYSTEELCRIGLSELAHPEELERLTANYVARLSGAAPQAHYETRIVRKDGTPIPVEVTAARTIWRREPADIVFVRDISLRKAALEALGESEARYRELVESLDEVVFASDSEGLLTYISPSAVPLAGYAVEEILGQPFTRFVHPEDIPEQRGRLARLQAGEALDPTELRIVCKSGEARWVRSSTRAVFGAGGVTGIRGVIVDIHARRQAEEELRELQHLHETLVEDAELGVSIVQDERIRYVNRTIARFVGYLPEELIGQPFTIIMPPEDTGARTETHRRRMRGEDVPRRFPVRVRHKDGTLLALENSASVVTYRGRPAMLVVVRNLGPWTGQRNATPR